MERGGDYERKLNNFSSFLSLLESVHYTVAVNTELMSAEPLLQEKKGLSPQEPLATTLSSTSQYKVLFHLCFFSKAPYLKYIVVHSHKNVKNPALHRQQKWHLFTA